MFRCIAVLCLLVIYGSAQCPFAAKGPTSHEFRTIKASDDALLAMNNFMLNAYTHTKKLIYSEVADRPVIWSEGDTLSLRFDSFRQDVNITPIIYSNLKMVAHCPFATFVILQPIVYLHHGNESSEEIYLDEVTLNTLEQYMNLAIAANASLETCCNFTADQLERQYAMMDLTINFQSSVIAKQTVSEDDLVMLANSTVGYINLNVKDAVISQLNLVHGYVMDWKENVLTEEQFDQLKVIVTGPHMPRSGSLMMQYFARLLNTPITSGLRIVYAEHVDAESDAIDLFATHLTDFSVGQAFWGDPDHMHSDIQAQATAEYLPTLLPNTTMPAN